MSDKNMNAKLSVNFTTASNRANIESNENISTSFGKISKYFSDLKTVAFSNSYNDLDNKPDIPDTSNFAPLSSNSYINFTSRGLANTWDDNSRISTEYVHNGTDVAGIDIEINGTGTDSSGNPVGTPEIQTYVDVNNNGTTKSTHWYMRFDSDNLSIKHEGVNKNYGTIFMLADGGNGDYIGRYTNGSTPDASLNLKYPTVKINDNVIGAAANTMTGYTKPQSTSAITASDTLNEAIGKLEKAMDGAGTPNDGVLTIQQNGNIIGTFSANQSSNETINIQALSSTMTSSAVKTNGTTTIIKGEANVTIIDRISYSNLATGVTYILKTQVYNTSTGDNLSITKDGVTSTEISTMITPTTNNGVYINTFSIDSTADVEVGDTIVVDEVLEEAFLGSISFLTVTAPKVYGFRIDKNDMNPDTRVTYLYDAVGMTPAYMDFTTHEFNYGSWGDAWFISENRPVALKYDGTVDYELDHTDFTKKLDGTASDVSSTAYAGNFMSEMPTVYVKRWEDTDYNYMAFSQVQIDSDYLAQAHTNINGNVVSYIYLPMFKGSYYGSGTSSSPYKLRSLMGTYPKAGITIENERTYVKNNGTGWDLWDKAKIDLIMDLILLITKSTNCCAKIGNGDSNTSNSSDTTNQGKMKSGYETDGSTRSTNAQFYGYEGTETTDYGKHHMTAFYIEDLWGNRAERILGFYFQRPSGGSQRFKIKMTPPYVNTSDSSYIEAPWTSGSGYWVKNLSTSDIGDVPVVNYYSGSITTGFACKYLSNTDGAATLGFGGNCGTGLGGVGRYYAFVYTTSTTNNYVGGSPCYTAP